MQDCTSLQTDNHASTPPLSFLQTGCSSCRPTNSVKALKGYKKNSITNKFHQNFTTFTTITGANRRRSFALTITQVLIAVAFCHFIIVIFCQCVSTAAIWKLARAAAPHYLQKSCNAIPYVDSTIIYKHNWLQFLFVVKGTASKQ